MPHLQDTREKLKLSISSIEGSEVVLRDGLLAGDTDFVYGSETTSDIERALRALAKMLISWNLTDDNEQPIPATLENIKKLNLKDVESLIFQTSFGKGAQEAGKKKVSSKR